MSGWRIAGVAVLMMGIGVVPAQAQTAEMYADQLAASGADRLVERLPANAQAVLDSLLPQGLTPQSFGDLSLPSVLQSVGALLQTEVRSPLATLAMLLAVIVLSAMFSGVGGLADRPALRDTYQTVSVLAGAGLLLGSFVSLLCVVWRAVDSVRVFMTAFVPVYAGIVMASGSPTSGLSYQTLLLAAAELLGAGIHTIVLPLLLMSLAFGCVGTVSPGFNLAAFSGGFYKAVLWGLGLFSALFSGILSLQQMVTAAGDSVSSRVMKFSLSGTVPLVGGLMSEAYSTVIGCAGLLRSTVGAFGVVATVVTVLPPLLSCVVWSICMNVGSNTAALFGLTAIQNLCRCIAGAVRVLIAILAVYGLMMIVSTSVLSFVMRG